MTDAELNDIERRANAATPGPWTHHTGYEQADPGDYVVNARGDIVCSEDVAPETADTVFITEARTAVPRLVAEARRSREVLSAGLAWRAAEHALLQAYDDRDFSKLDGARERERTTLNELRRVLDAVPRGDR